MEALKMPNDNEETNSNAELLGPDSEKLKIAEEIRAKQRAENPEPELEAITEEEITETVEEVEEEVSNIESEIDDVFDQANLEERDTTHDAKLVDQDPELKAQVEKIQRERAEAVEQAMEEEPGNASKRWFRTLMFWKQ